MPGLVPGIHVLLATSKTWTAGTSPAMTSIAVSTERNMRDVSRTAGLDNARAARTPFMIAEPEP